MNLWTKRSVAVAIGTLAGLAPVAGLCMLQAYDRAMRGTWYCRVCCTAEERTARVLGVEREELEPSHPDFDVTRNFHEWFERSVGLEHDHDWTPSGCHYSGSTVYCSDQVSDLTFYRSLPYLPDQGLAREIVAFFVSRDAEGRRSMISDLQQDPGPFAAVAARKPITEAEFVAAYEDWSAARPHWR